MAGQSGTDSSKTDVNNSKNQQGIEDVEMGDGMNSDDSEADDNEIDQNKILPKRTRGLKLAYDNASEPSAGAQQPGTIFGVEADDSEDDEDYDPSKVKDTEDDNDEEEDSSDDDDEDADKSSDDEKMGN